ncbi:hypothetical protein C5708_04565 [Caulobacter sp. CCUG 60055]|uniref:hypothetical protein n=1 Tax=Caulobacter sp. CCUG 60055 TaxID=2100090 RepID=UPI001FA6CC92|nr:hypothetical protein [Caulobacter sp. CCUG 60055]MCI3179521.1 hypothetical protein [Caulobacter sp. CCUG 60055]
MSRAPLPHPPVLVPVAARLCVAAAGVALAAASPAPATIGGPPDASVCVTVEVAGARSGTLDCAAARLRAAAQAAQDKAAQDRAADGGGLDAPSARSSAAVVGAALPAATRQRLGSAYGHGVRPQRPAPPVYTPPLGKTP